VVVVDKESEEDGEEEEVVLLKEREERRSVFFMEGSFGRVRRVILLVLVVWFLNGERVVQNTYVYSGGIMF